MYVRRLYDLSVNGNYLNKLRKVISRESGKTIMILRNKFLIGLVIIFLGLSFNKWIIEKFLPDGSIEGLSYIIQILIVQLFLILCGIYLIIRNERLKRVIIILLVLIPFLTISLKNGIDFLNARKHMQSLPQTMLDQVIFLEENKIAKLSQETGEILYLLHQGTVPLNFKIPEDGVLDTAIGVDPLIVNLFIGEIHFELSINTNSGNSKTIFRKEIDLLSMSKNDFIWQNVSIDLSEYSGSEITLEFKKGYKIDDQKKPNIVYDLLPIDFMYWRIPNVRPKQLKDKHNVILISVDTLRGDHLHFMGYPRETSPNMDKLAQNGVFFTSAVSQAPWTAPSHLAIFTSTYPTINRGNFQLSTYYRSWNDTLPTMASILRDRDYVTAAFTAGGVMSAKLGFYKGFDLYNETILYDEAASPERVKCDSSDVEQVITKSMEWLSNNKNRTFFLFIHTYEPHSPYCDEFFLRKEKINKSETIEYRTALYDGDIRRADLFVGKLIEKLNELQLTDNTIIAITSDHGEDLGNRYHKDIYGHGHDLYDELLLVPLIFYNPKILPRGKRIDYQVRLIDILPTILEYLGYKEEPSFQGKSLKEMIEGNDQIPRPAYSEATRFGTERESIRANGYKYLYRISYGQLSDPMSRKMPLTPLHELYNLNADPAEKINLAEKQERNVEEYQRLILSIFPKKTFKDHQIDSTIRSVDIGKDEELMKSLKSLGYIQ